MVDRDVELAHQAGVLGEFKDLHPDMVEFVKLIRADERERILEMCKEGWWDGAGIRFHLEKRAEALTNMNKAAEDNGEPL